MINNNDRYSQQNIDAIAEHFRAIMELLGEDTSREGLQKTPQRAARALLYNTYGYEQDPAEILHSAIFSHPGSEIVVVKNIEFYSLCEHHILPFFGTISVGYIPDGKIVGLSKIARIVNTYARRLQVQERLTSQICDLLSSELSSKGVIVHCQAQHLCMKMRGVEKQNSSTTTLQYQGAFSDINLRNEFLALIKE